MNLHKVINMQELRQKQEDPLNLGSLPLLEPGEDGWPAIESALLEQTREQRVRRIAGGALAAAATVVLAVTLMPGQPFNPAATNLPDSAQAPPLTLTLSWPMPTSRMAAIVTTANASLIS